MRKLIGVASMVAMVAIFIGLWVAPGAQAVTYHGGTPAQQAEVSQTLATCVIPLADIDRFCKEFNPSLDGLTVYLSDGVPPADVFPCILKESFDEHGGAWYAGNIWLNNSQAMSKYISYYLRHEVSHAIGSIDARFQDEWLDKYSQITVPGVEYFDPSETFAMNGTEYLFNTVGTIGMPASSDGKQLPDIGRLEFVKDAETWSYGTIGRSYIDLFSENDELLAAAGLQTCLGAMLGDQKGHFDAYQSLLRSQIYLIVERSGHKPPEQWQNDYSPASRGDVNQMFAGLAWNGSNWDQSITRGQFARLLWRLHLSQLTLAK